MLFFRSVSIFNESNLSCFDTFGIVGTFGSWMDCSTVAEGGIAGIESGVGLGRAEVLGDER